MKATMVKPLHFQVSNGLVTVAVEFDEEGNASFLSHTIGKRAPQEFKGDEITTTPSKEGTRATVVLDDGQADRPVVRFTVIVPEVIPGDASSFDVSAAGLTSTREGGIAGPQPGPQHTYEAHELKGTVTIVGGEQGTCRDWQAIHDLMPGHPATLTVTGTCTFPTPGFEVELRPSVPQGINPRDLLLDKIVMPPSGPVPDVLTDVAVCYEEVTDVKYETVTIMPGGPQIKVQRAH